MHKPVKEVLLKTLLDFSKAMQDPNIVVRYTGYGKRLDKDQCLKWEFIKTLGSALKYGMFCYLAYDDHGAEPKMPEGYSVHGVYTDRIEVQMDSSHSHKECAEFIWYKNEKYKYGSIVPNRGHYVHRTYTLCRN